MAVRSYEVSFTLMVVHFRGKRYVYPRYNFTNASGDIRALFTSACGHLRIEWRQMSARNISVAKRSSIECLDAFAGPQY
jgi:hypothetical protein